MLTRFRIEVQEATAEECVQALDNYEHALQQQEARRYRGGWPVVLEAVDSNPEKPKYADPAEQYPTPDQPWDEEERGWYSDELGREITEEVIEFDASLPGYRGRRVVRFSRLDMRQPFVALAVQPYFQVFGSGVDSVSTSV